MRLHNAYKWPFWEHIIDHISKTGTVHSLKFSGKQDLKMHFCISLIKCSYMTQFFCSIDITWKNLNQHHYLVLADVTSLDMYNGLFHLLYQTRRKNPLVYKGLKCLENVLRISRNVCLFVWFDSFLFISVNNLSVMLGWVSRIKPVLIKD